MLSLKLQWRRHLRRISRNSDKGRMIGSGLERKSACSSGGPAPEVHPPNDLRILRATGPLQRARGRDILGGSSSPEDPQRLDPLRPQPETRRALLLTGPKLQVPKRPLRSRTAKLKAWAWLGRSSAKLNTSGKLSGTSRKSLRSIAKHGRSVGPERCYRSTWKGSLAL